MIKYEARPAVLYSKKATAVDMILIAVIRSEACARIEDYNGTTKHSKVIEEVEIALVHGERVNVDTHVYVWDEPLSYMEPTLGASSIHEKLNIQTRRCNIGPINHRP
jgi:hypothetical protein